MINSAKLKARIIEKGKTIGEVAPVIGLTPYTLGQKIAGKSEMTLKEADRLQQLLEISDSDFASYFFAR